MSDCAILLAWAEKRKDLTFESATVTAHGNSNWSSTFTISKGSNADIAVDDCVLDDYGNLVGVVAEIGTNWAEVRTVVDAGDPDGGRFSPALMRLLSWRGTFPSWEKAASS